jgi:hypothetical protein
MKDFVAGPHRKAPSFVTLRGGYNHIPGIVLHSHLSKCQSSTLQAVLDSFRRRRLI